MNIKSKITIALIIVAIISITSIIAYQQTRQLEPVIDTKSTSISLELQRAKNFQVSYIGGNKILIDGANRTITLTPIAKLNKEVQIPISRMIIFSSTHAALIDRLGISDRVIGVAWGGNYEWYIDGIKDGLQNGRIKDIGPSNSPNYDELVALNPDLVVLVGGTGLWENHAKKLDELGINYVVNSEWLEDDPLGRFEWIKFFSLFTNDEERASKIYDEVAAETSKISDKVSNLEKPDVLWASVFRGTVYIPRAESYVAKVIEMAGGNYIFNDIHGIGSAQISLEELISRADNAEVMIYSSHLVNNTNDIMAAAPLLSEIKQIQSCNVYAFQPWYWQKLDRVDDTLADVAAIIHPEQFPNYQLKQFKELSCE